MEEVSGGRMHYMFNRVGGLKEDLPAGWLARTSAAIAAVRGRLPDTSRTSSSATRSSGPAPVGSASSRRSWSPQYGVSGPIARASGVDFDLRRDDPYLAYGELLADGVLRVVDPARPATAWRGSRCLLDQVQVSLDLADACLDRLGRAAAGPDQRAAAQGAQGAGGRTPTAGPRTRWASTATTWSPAARRRRGGSSCARRRSTTCRCCPSCCPGTVIADMVAILGSMFFVVGDIDK